MGFQNEETFFDSKDQRSSYTLQFLFSIFKEKLFTVEGKVFFQTEFGVRSHPLNESLKFI